MDQDEGYVRRQRGSRDEKLAIVEEAVASGNVIGSAKRHGFQAQLDRRVNASAPLQCRRVDA